MSITKLLSKICPSCNNTFKTYLSANSKHCSSKCYGKSLIGHAGYFNGKKRLNVSGNNHWNWKGGKTKNTASYILIYQPNHPHKDKDGYVREHRLIAEKYLDRIIKKEEVIHHINHIRTDNRPENLYIFSTQLEHRRFHAKEYLLISNII